jgi:hypothetical protein
MAVAIMAAMRDWAQRPDGVAERPRHSAWYGVHPGAQVSPSDFPSGYAVISIAAGAYEAYLAGLGVVKLASRLGVRRRDRTFDARGAGHSAHHDSVQDCGHHEKPVQSAAEADDVARASSVRYGGRHDGGDAVMGTTPDRDH